MVRRLLATVPASTAASTLVEAGADVVYDGPAERFTLGTWWRGTTSSSIVDEVLALSPLVEEMLDELAESPLVASLASRFVGRIVSEVLPANKAVAEKIPGLGWLMSFGASAARKVMGGAEKQFEQLLGDTAGKGAVFAMRRLNKIVVDTMSRPDAA